MSRRKIDLVQIKDVFTTPYPLSFGEYTYGQVPTIYGNHFTDSVTVGKFCSIAANVTILVDTDHRTDWISTYAFSMFNQFPEGDAVEENPIVSRGPINIGNDVWIGRNVTICSGVTIGDGAIIAVGAIVTRDIPPYCIAGGIPAKVVKQRFSDEIIKNLLEIQWWNWPIEKIRKFIPLLNNSDIDEFLTWSEQSK